ncbi:hypothetical protein H9I45_09975 [Polaribacter haliotis]|uniref:Uncharacterized protein n=1 Tax=Polaribacter haliotis TaxID=1888915 RepID=A0A7L8ACN1_9FLAO|nr:hypothetical protein [Polaribacter haliotis]QOD59684.1 hypothetical protein H9I45_09975 [Polaribacter haliotis]
MSTNQPKNNEEEVDLGSLFVIIGKGFKNFFNFIGNIFKGIFHAIISVLIFIKDNIIKIGIGAVIGFAIGLFLQVRTTDRFESDMLVQPNFKSSRQLYNNVNYYNDLVKQKDTLGLQTTFNLNEVEAVSLRKFIIEPIVNQNDVIDSYNDFIQSVDTTTVKSYTFEDFKASFTDLDYKVHKINVISEKNNIFNKLDDVIISSVVKNKYFNRLKELTNENLNRTDSILRENLTQIDTLRKVYMQVMVEEAKKQTTGTSIDLGGEKRPTKELELFETNNKINSNLKNIAIDKSEKYEVINVISNFQPIGTKISGITKNKAVQLAILGALLMVFILLLLKLNAFLNTYKK